MLVSQKNFLVSFPDFSRKVCVGAAGSQHLRAEKLNLQCVSAAQPGQELHLWQDLHIQAIPRASPMSLSNNSERKGEAKA